ncbi:hypothetical protein HELRODRAFT_128131, partial [Helobdella robusta]|uniref:EGF-like domain-containing protein n=1 Tax=Helobdella robusta TaxID=6412 RepID=T1EHL1_HELRO
FSRCIDNPCHDGATCLDSDQGYKCKCPDWMTGTGERGQGCTAIAKETCTPSPCYANVQCTMNDTLGPVCGPCPNGLKGDGYVCNDIDECKDYQPCDPLTKCTNHHGGFTCSDCPSGF